METIRWTRIMLRATGCSLELSTYTPLRRFLYQIYANMLLLLLYCLLILQALDLVLVVENRDEFTENFAIMAMGFNILLKKVRMSMQRLNFLTLLKRLEDKYFVPVTKQELEIRLKFDRMIESTSKAYTKLLMFFAFWMLFASIVVGFSTRKLVFRLWLPYNHTSVSVYILTSVYEIMVTYYGVSISSACECLYTGLIFHVCCQFEILEHRFRMLNTNPVYTVNQCASHHHLIYKYAEAVNEEFKVILSFQFFSSISMMCLTIYQLAYAENSAVFMGAGMYLMCVFLQIFYYCLCGNVVKTKSTDLPDEIFSSGWPSWNDSSKKVLLMVIRRSKTPIEFTSMHIVTLTLESFMTLLKTSYSAFNLMQSSRKG